MSSEGDGQVQVQVSPAATSPSVWALVLAFGFILGLQIALGSKVDGLRADIHRLERELRLEQAYTNALNNTLARHGIAVPRRIEEATDDAR